MSPLKNLYWIEEFLPSDVISKKMASGMGYYVDDKLMVVISEESKTIFHRGVSYPFQLYYGCFFPIVKIKHNAVIAKFPFLENHPVKKDWLYIPAENEEFESEVKLVLREINKRNKLFGIEIKWDKEDFEDTIPDMSKPSLFNTDAPKAKSRKKEQPKPKPKSPRKTKIKLNKKSENSLMLSILKGRR